MEENRSGNAHHECMVVIVVLWRFSASVYAQCECVSEYKCLIV